MHVAMIGGIGSAAAELYYRNLVSNQDKTFYL
jgi:hypothetical protein